MDEAVLDAEIQILADGILHWLNENDGDVGQPIVDAIKRVAVEDCIILGVDDALWIHSEAWDFINPEHRGSDAWFYAVIDAIERFKAQFVLTEVES